MGCYGQNTKVDPTAVRERLEVAKTYLRKPLSFWKKYLMDIWNLNNAFGENIIVLFTENKM